MYPENEEVKNVKNYQMIVEGEDPVKTIKQEIAFLKENLNELNNMTQSERDNCYINPNLELIQSKRMELVSIPDGVSTSVYINEFLASPNSQENVAYVGILEMGKEKVEYKTENVLSKTPELDETKQKGARKWVTKYVVRAICEDNGTDEFLNSFDTKGDAMKYAKEKCLDDEVEVLITIEKVLDGSIPHVATYKPKYNQEYKAHITLYNRFLVFGKSYNRIELDPPLPEEHTSEEEPIIDQSHSEEKLEGEDCSADETLSEEFAAAE